MTAALEAMRGSLERIVAQPQPGWQARVRSVIVVACSSRGGSSVFAELLRQSADLLHCRAEANPCLRLGGLGFPESATGSDALDASHVPAADSFCRLLRADVGQPTTRFDGEADRRRFAVDLWARLQLQWPWLVFDCDEVATWAVDALAEHPLPQGRDEAVAFHLSVLKRARARHPAVNPFYYDLPPHAVRAAFPDVVPPEGPPGPVVLEEPPFLAIGPWRPATEEQLARLPLVLKTPSDAYRLPFLRRLFPSARFRVLHLTRNAAAAINGLVEGWLHHGFFSHRLTVPLDLAGYSDVRPGWGREWWNFDVPPDWQEWTGAPLVEVCALQWRTAHRAILDETAGLGPAEVHRFRFEDLIGGPGRRDEALTSLCNWLGIPAGPLIRVAAAGLPPIMTTSAPCNRRWQARGRELAPALEDARVREVMRELGYGDDPDEWL